MMTLIVQGLQKFIFPRLWLTFIVMASCFGLFGAGTLNIFHMFSSNWDMLTHGQWMSGHLLEAIWQLLELLLTLFTAMFFYTLFKVCEYELVQRLKHNTEKGNKF